MEQKTIFLESLEYLKQKKIEHLEMKNSVKETQLMI